MGGQYEGRDLLQAAENMDCNKLVEFATKNKIKKSGVSFKTLLSEMSEEEMGEGLWGPLSKEVEQRTKTLLLATNKKNKQVERDACQFLQAAIDLGVAFFELEGAPPACTPLLAIVDHLNSALLELPSSLDALRNSIACLCEKVLVSREQTLSQEHIGLNTLLYILGRSLAPRAAKKEVRRVCALRPLLPCLLPSPEVLQLMKQAAKSPIYTNNPEGAKVLVASLTTDVDLVAEIHAAVKQRLNVCTLTQASAYGKIYYQAWLHAVKNDLSDLKDVLEMTCIQDFILLAIQDRNKQFVTNLRKVLAQFHSQKKEVYVAKMLHFLYTPILWRYIKNPEGIVRANAAQLFLNVFPLEDPDSRLVTTDQELNEQMLLIKDLLLDEYPIVRSGTVIGLCIAMSVNWELFSEDMLKTYFRIIINDLSCDSTSVDVRCAVAKGLKVVLENPLTHSTMEQLLPKVSHLFNDNADSVRAAFTQLLIRIKRIANIKFYRIVTLESLLARLAEDGPLCRPLVSLLHNSFLPPGKPPAVWMHRCVEMVKTNRQAARVFFGHCSTHCTLPAIAAYMSRVVECVHFFVGSKACSRRLSVCSSSAEVEVEVKKGKEEEAVGLQDPEVVVGLLDGVSVLWLTNMTQLEQPENKQYLKMVVSKLTKCLGDLSLYYKESPAWQAVYYLCSFMPSLPSLAPLCFVRLQALPPTAPDEDCITLLECLCAQEGASLVQLLRDWLKEGLTLADASKAERPPPPKKRKKLTKKKKKQQQGEEEEEDDEEEDRRHHLALRMFKSMLERRTCQKALRVANPDALKGLLHCMEDIKTKVELRGAEGKKVAKKEAEFVKCLHLLMLKIAVTLRGEDQFNGVRFVEEGASWLQSKFLRPPPPNNSTRRSVLLPLPPTPSFQRMVWGMCKDLCSVMTDMTLVGFLNMKSLKFLKFGMSLLQLDEFGGEGVLRRVLLLILRHTTWAGQLGEDGGAVLRMLPDCLAKIFHHLNREEFFESLTPKELKEGGFLLSVCLQQLQGELQSAALLSLARSLLLTAHQEGEEWNSFEDLTVSGPGTLLLSSVCTDPKMILSFLQQLQHHVTTAEMDAQSWAACFAVVNTVQEYKKCTQLVKRELLLLLKEMEGGLRRPLKSLDSDANIPPSTPSKDTRPSCEQHWLSECDRLREQLTQKTAAAAT